VSEKQPESDLPEVSGNQALKLAVRNVAALNLGYFGIEFAVAIAIGSVALFADSVDFLEDGAVNLLILAGIGWSAARRAKLGMVLAAIILVPALATLWTAWQNFSSDLVPAAAPLTVTGLGAMLVNFTAARILAPFRTAGGSLTRAAFLSARNDVIANITIVAAGLLTAATASRWPDLIVGIAIAVLNAGAAHEVYEAARSEHVAAKP
jgi:Co/Zn/Cd efflux system component